MQSLAPDIRLRVDFRRHPKVRKLHRRLGAEGILSLIDLWCWARVNRPTGILNGMSPEDIEVAAEWTGAAGELFETLKQVALLDVEDLGTISIHGWADHQPWSMESEKRVKKARRAAEGRWKAQRCSDDAQASIEQCSDDAQASPSIAKPMLKHQSSNAPDLTETETLTGPDSDRDQTETSPDQDTQETRIKPAVVVPVVEIVSLAQSKNIPVKLIRDGTAPHPTVVEAVTRTWKAKAEHRSLDWWRDLFEEALQSRFLREEFSGFGLLWLCGPKIIKKVTGGFYGRERQGGAPPGRRPMTNGDQIQQALDRRLAEIEAEDAADATDDPRWEHGWEPEVDDGSEG